MDSVARGVRFWQLARLGVGGRAWASLIGDLGAMSGGGGWLAGDASTWCQGGYAWFREVVWRGRASGETGR